MKKNSTLLALVAACAISTMALGGASAAPQQTTKPKTTPQTQPQVTPHTTTPGKTRSGMKTHDGFDSAAYKARSEMTQLWAEHEAFVRNYIVSASAGLPDAQSISNRLLENANEIGQSLQPYYGDSASQKLTTLMRDHVMILAELVQVASGNPVGTTGSTGTMGRPGTTGTGTSGGVTGNDPTGTTGTGSTSGTGSASSDRTNTNGTTDRNMGGTTGSTTTPPTTGNTGGVYGTTRNTTPGINNPNVDKDRLSEVQRRLETNGKNIAAFLNSSNPNWKQSDIEGMMQQHIDHVVAQVTARANGDWQGDLQAFDEALDGTFKFADTLSQGIERQFPDRFAQAKR